MARPAGDAEKRAADTNPRVVTGSRIMDAVRAVYCRLISRNKKDRRALNALARDTPCAINLASVRTRIGEARSSRWCPRLLRTFAARLPTEEPKVTSSCDRPYRFAFQRLQKEETRKPDHAFLRARERAIVSFVANYDEVSDTKGEKGIPVAKADGGRLRRV